MLGLLAMEGERTGYDLLKLARRSVAHVWAPAKSQLYAVLPRLERAGLARSRAGGRERGPDRRLYRITKRGELALNGWLETVEPGDRDGFYLKSFLREPDEPGRRSSATTGSSAPTRSSSSPSTSSSSRRTHGEATTTTTTSCCGSASSRRSWP